MAKPAPFAATQRAFAAHIRDPRRHAAPADIEDRRMAVYRELLYNNVESFIANAYPVLRAISDDRWWHAVVRDYFARHIARTPLFPRMPGEFLAYLVDERRAAAADPPFLAELAHYEWMELALAQSDDEIDMRGVDPDGDLLAGVPVLSPLAIPLSYRFPVHRIGPDFLPDAPGTGPTCLAVYRDRHDDVHFMETSAATYRLLQLLAEDRTVTGEQLLARLADEMRHPHPRTVINGGRAMLDDLRGHDIVLGTRIAR